MTKTMTRPGPRLNVRTATAAEIALAAVLATVAPAVNVGAAAAQTSATAAAPIASLAPATAGDVPVPVGPDAVVPAPHALQDPADSLYRAARVALREGRNRRAARLFGEIVDRHPDSEYAPDALYWGAFALYRVGDRDALREALVMLERQDSRYPDAATRRDAETLAVRIRSVLARFGDPEAAAAIEATAETAVAALAPPAAGSSDAAVADRAEEAADPCEDDPDHELRVMALNALVHMDGDRALPIVRQVLDRRDACSAELRERALFVISRMDSPDVAEILIDAARADPSDEVRTQAVYWLSNVESEAAIDALVEVLRSSASTEVREHAVYALARHDSPRALGVLRDAVFDETLGADVREAAIFHLARHATASGDPARTNELRGQIGEFLRSLYGRLEDDDLRENVLFATARLGGEDNHRWLMGLALDDGEPIELRKQALYHASRVAGTPLEPLLELYDELEDREMKEHLIFVYSRRDEPAALDKVIEIAREESDPELRRRAVFWLSRSGDPRALDVLREIISS